MENKTIDIEPRAAVEMQTWENIYDRVPSQYKQYVSYPTTTMQECPSKAEINDKLTHARIFKTILVGILLKLRVSLSTLRYCYQIWE